MSTETRDYGPVAGPAEVEAYADICTACFNSPPDVSREWLARVGHESIRVVRHGGKVVAGLLLVPMGQWFGGRAVPMTGIAGVGVPVDRRGQGHAVAIMRACVAELAADGVPLSGLYPSTARLYRKAGWEMAGHRYFASVPPARIGLAERELPVRAMTEADGDAVAQAAARRAAGFPGALERGPYIWNRIRKPRDQHLHGWVVERDGRIDAWVSFVQAPGAGYLYDLRCTDIGALSAQGGRRVLTLLADHGTMANEAVFASAPHDPLLNLMPDRSWSLKVKDPWMLRLTDVPGALTARGWPAGLACELLLDVSDDVVPGNNGRWLLELADGAAQVSPAPAGGTADALGLDVRGLAALYSGHLPPAALEQAGLLTGGQSARRLAAAAFAGPAPCMFDMF